MPGPSDSSARGGGSSHPFLRDRIARKLETLSDERLYQVLDYVDFLESRYAQRPAAPANVFTRFAEGIEDTMRAGKLSASTIAETMSLMNRAMGVLSGVAAAGRSVASDVMSAAARTGPKPGETATTSAPTPRAATTTAAGDAQSAPPPGAPPGVPGTTGDSTT